MNCRLGEQPDAGGQSEVDFVVVRAFSVSFVVSLHRCYD